MAVVAAVDVMAPVVRGVYLTMANTFLGFQVPVQRCLFLAELHFPTNTIHVHNEMSNVVVRYSSTL